MIKMNLLDYACFQINHFENVFQKRLNIDFVEYSSHVRLGVSASYYLNAYTGETVVEIPNTYNRREFKEFLVHEFGHALLYLDESNIPNYLSNLLGYDGTFCILPYWLKSSISGSFQRLHGYPSSYSITTIQEEFCELLSFVVCNKNRKRYYDFGGERIDLLLDKVLLKKVKAMKRYLRIE